LAKARRSDIKDMFFSKFTISKINEDINEKTDERKIELKISELNELIYTEFNSID
jgi:hypothetical protein